MDDDHSLLTLIRQPDLSILGESIRTLPAQLWKTRMMFAGVPDVTLKDITGSFPATFRKGHTTHPVFVLENIAVYAHKVCPCSSKGDRRRQRYVPKGCRLDMSNQVMDRNSFLVEKYTFQLPADRIFVKNLRFMGRVPEGTLQGHGGKRS